MPHGSTYQKKKDEIIRLIKDSAAPKPQVDTPADRPRSALVCFLIFTLCLLGTTIPHANLNTFFSIAAITSGLVWFHLWWRSGRRFNFSGWKTAALAVALVSQVAGCAGLMMNDQPLDLVALGIQSDKIKVGEAQGLGIAGFGLQDVTPQAAMQNGNIQKAIGTQELRSYALVSMVKIRVYGE
ncbi:hypothetical protein [Desulfuromonas sp. TF]|uniref:hypothetical protein n=1 Tax=Desulfuromonas sp. TF TaxID=1232410 RepID=UPI000404681C|nr:hypothetical protein [Desulfuromonas sp. TF]